MEKQKIEERNYFPLIKKIDHKHQKNRIPLTIKTNACRIALDH